MTESNVFKTNYGIAAGGGESFDLPETTATDLYIQIREEYIDLEDDDLETIFEEQMYQDFESCIIPYMRDGELQRFIDWVKSHKTKENNTYDGILTFTTDIKAKELNILNSYLGRHYPEESFQYTNLQLLEDFSGIEWNGADNTIKMAEQLEFVINKMRKEVNQGFGLNGSLLEQGETEENRYIITVNHDKVTRSKETIPYADTICPNCFRFFKAQTS